MEKDNYSFRRLKNNEAVKKSRTKSKNQAQAMIEKVKKLKAENSELTEKIQCLTMELKSLKQIFMAHAGSAQGMKLTTREIELLQEDNGGNEIEMKNSYY